MGNPKQPPAREAAVGEQPAIGGSQYSAENRGAQQQHDGAGDLLTSISAEAGAAIPQPLQASLDQSRQWQQGCHSQHHR